MSLSNNIYPIFKKRFYQALDTYSVYLTDTSITSPNYFVISDVPALLTAGKNIFKIKANNKNLLIGSELLFEVVDVNKKVIYSETSTYLDRNGNRVITIYVYPDTTPGIAQITILGIANNDLITEKGKQKIIPVAWQNKYNIKWTYKIQIDPLKRNDSEILLETAPNISINEIFRQSNIYTPTYNLSTERRVNNNTIYTSSGNFSASYYNLSNAKQIAGNYGRIQSQYTQYLNGIPSNINANTNDLTNADAIQYQTMFSLQNVTTGTQLTSKHGAFHNTDSYPVISVQNINPSSPFQFKKEMIGGVINIPNPQGVTPVLNNNSYLQASDKTYSATIVNVLNKDQIQVDKPYSRKVIDSRGLIQDVYFTQLGQSDFEVTYSGVYSVDNSEAFKNFAEININNVNLVGGDVYRIKPYVKSITDASDYIPQTDVIIDSKNILITTSSIVWDEPMGDFQSSTFFNDYWVVNNQSAYNITSTFDNTKLLNAYKFKLTQTPSPTNDKPVLIYHKLPITSMSFYQDNLYQISMNVIGERNVNTANRSPEMKIAMYGSAFNNETPMIVSPSGSLIGTIKCPDNQNSIAYKNITFNIIPDNDGIGYVELGIFHGDWYISDIKVTNVKLPGFTPSHFKFLVPLQPIWDNDNLDFKFELYDYKGKMSSQILYLKNVTFNHGYSHFIQGKYNLATGSIWLGQKRNTGILMTGEHSGIVQSVGYEGRNYADHGGTPGFILWSGSFMLEDTGSVYQTSYSGVGIEMHGGSGSGHPVHALHFDTDSGRLEITGSIVATDAVFQNYCVSDYMGSRVITIDASNKSTYFPTYSFNGETFEYLDLSAAVTDSAMFVRIESNNLYPLTHIQIPEMYSFADNQIGGNITLEFADNLTNEVYFYEHTASAEFSGSSYTPALPLLEQTNAIRNYSGSISYLGFNQSMPAALYPDKTFLKSRNGARYIFTKGVNGYGLTSCTNYDAITTTYKDVIIKNQFGTRNNIWISPDDVRFDGTNGTVNTVDFNGFNAHELYSSTLSSGYYIVGGFSFDFLVPEYIINPTGSIFHYFTWNVSTGTPKQSEFINQSYSKIVNNISTVSTLNITSSISILDDIAIPISAPNTIYIEREDLNTISSGDIITYKFTHGYRNVSSIFYLGSRIVFDWDYNFGNFDNGVMPVTPKGSTTK